MQNNSAAPDGYNSVQPYLIVKDAADAMTFYDRAFGASERLCMKAPDGTVGHAEIVISNACVMPADEHPSIGAHAPEHYGGSPISLMVM
jgi:PhnB protein